MEEENKKSHHPTVESRRDIYKRWENQRYPENPEDVLDKGMDIGDYGFIDKHLFHCGTVNWVE